MVITLINNKYELIVLDNDLIATKENRPWVTEPEIKHQFITLNEAMYKLKEKGYKIIRVEG